MRLMQQGDRLIGTDSWHVMWNEVDSRDSFLDSVWKILFSSILRQHLWYQSRA